MTDDIRLAEKIISPGEKLCSCSWVKVMRDRSLLLALPTCRRLALATLCLYQPQKLKGKFLKFVLRCLVKIGFHRLLPKFELGIGNQGIFAGLDEVTERGELGFLLSSPKLRARNLIGLYEVGGKLRVVKAGCGDAAEVVRREYASMKRFADVLKGVPECISTIDFENGTAYVAELVLGDSPHGAKQENEVFLLMEKWLDSGTRVCSKELDCWKQVASSLSPEKMDRYSALAAAEIISPVMHGDLAPWNIKITPQGEVKILDWEFAEASGFPGWDWLHYNVQRMLLVLEFEAHEVVEKCIELMHEDSFAEYLNKAGLKGHEHALLESYLIYSDIVVGCPRGDLLNLLDSKYARDEI